MAFRLRSKTLGTALLTVSLISSYSPTLILGHIFSSNESVSFISLVDQIQAALFSISRYDSSNTTAIREQAQHARILVNDSVIKELKEKNQRIAAELPQVLDSLQNISTLELNSTIDKLKDLLSDAINVRIEKDQLKNTTIHALAIAEDVDKIFEEYNTAYNNSNVPMNMSMSMNPNNMQTTKNITNNETIKNMNAYLRAEALTDITINRFNTELKLESDSPSMQEIQNGLEELKMSIQSKESPSKLTEVVHGQIHPNLQTAFDLELAKSSTNSNTSMHVSGH